MAALKKALYGLYDLISAIMSGPLVHQTVGCLMIFVGQATCPFFKYK